MMKTPALIFAALLSTAAFAQTPPDVPPTQAPAGDPGKMSFKRPPKAEKPATDAAPAAPMTKEEKRAARKEKRAEKVGAKPVD